LIKAKERAVHVEKKLEAARKTLLQARRAAELHVQDVEQLQQQLADVEQRRRDFDGDQEAQGRSQGRDVRLEEQQVRFCFLFFDFFATRTGQVQRNPVEQVLCGKTQSMV